MRKLLIVVCVLVVGLIAVGALVAVPLLRGLGRPNTFHRKLGWEAEDFFTDPKVIELCEAIERNDLPSMENLIAEGANVNAVGEGGMTPLLWAYPDNKIERFELLLKHGADPNVIFTSSFNAPAGFIEPGQSVTELCAVSSFPKHFELVMQFGGDPDFVNPVSKRPLISSIICFGGQDTKKRVELLVDRKVNLNVTGDSGIPLTFLATNWYSQYDLALFLLESGADLRQYDERQNARLIHMVLLDRENVKRLSPRVQEAHQRLLDWLVAHGESLEDAEKDIQKWKGWGSLQDSERMRLRKEETAARKAKETAEQKSAAEK